MDAFVQRSPRRLFLRDRFVLWAPGARRALQDEVEGEGEGADGEPQAALISALGGQIVDAAAADAGELVLLVPDAASWEPLADEAATSDMLRRFPAARVVTAAWVRDCAARKTRLPTAAYEVPARAKASGAVALAAERGGDGAEREPPRKRVKAAVAAGEGAGAGVGVGVARPGGGAGGGAGAKPHFRPWQSVEDGSLLVLDARPPAAAAAAAAGGRSVKVAAFDLDGTLIVTKSGKRFAQSERDWQWLHPTRVPGKLAELLAEGYDLVLFSNQNGVEKGKVAAAEVQRKVSAIVQKLDLPMLVFLATRADRNRKPRVGAWARMVETLRPEGAVSMDEIFYCGDAAGRPKAAGRAKDFAATDYKFALNLGVRFVTPEALFLASKQRLHTHPDEWDIGFDPRTIPVGPGPVLVPASSDLTKQHQEIVVLAGPPASGKSHLVSASFPTYVAVNQDELRTLVHCKKACLEALASGKSVVIDATNRSKPTRKEWIAIAQSQKLPVRCFEMDVPKPLAMHLNVFRSLTTGKKIPDIAIHGFYKNYTQPEVSEGFEEVVKVQLRIDRAALSDENFQLVRSFL